MPLLLVLAAVSGAGDVPEVGKRPELPNLVLTSTEGQPQSLSDLRGAVTVLNFWATWCGPCRIELPELAKLANDLGSRGVFVLAVNVEGPRVPVRAFMERLGVALPVYFIDPVDERELGISSLPFTLILDKGGRVVRAYPGYSPAAMADLRSLALALLDEAVQ